MPSSLAQALYLTRQHQKRTVPSGIDNNIIIHVVSTDVGDNMIHSYTVTMEETAIYGKNHQTYINHNFYLIFLWFI